MGEWYITKEDAERVGPFHYSNRCETPSDQLKKIMAEQLEALTTYIAGMIAPAMPIGRVIRTNPPDENGDIMIEVEISPGSFVWKEGEAPKSVAEHFRGRCGVCDSNEHKTTNCPPKAPKYPNECPCGIKASDCTYHANL